ncbi:MAG TPA: GNAT family N-acetyltransferase [Candidatus Limnocylindria bacterium]
MPLELIRARDADDFERLAFAFLGAREAEHNLLFGIVAGVRAGMYDEPPYFAVVRDGARVVAAALRTPPFNLILSAIDDERAVPLFAEDASRWWADLPGIGAQKRDAKAFASLWSERTGARAALHSEQRIYRLATVIPPRPAGGRLRRAEPADVPLVAEWLRSFSEEALRHSPEVDQSRIAAERFVSGLGGRAMYLWNADGPVAMTAVVALTPNGSRIGAVYTRPELRRRGYASALVAAVSQGELAAGRRFCFLFTDLANPTSNKIYQAIGYEPVCDVDEYRFEVASPLA